MKTQELVIGGCTGSNSPRSVSLTPLDDGSERLITHHLDRGEFGTLTTALAMVLGDVGILIDNGSGIQHTVEYLKSRKVKNIYLLQSHYHLDHVSGIPNNSLLFRNGGITEIFGPRLGLMNFGEVLKHIFPAWLWPVSPEMFNVSQNITNFFASETLPILGGVRTVLLNHPGGSIGYRIPGESGDVVIATDSELQDESSQKALAQFSEGAHLMYVDVQYRDSEYVGDTMVGEGDMKMSRKGWGHSTPTMLFNTMKSMVNRPQRLVIGHHDPKRMVEDLHAFEKEMQMAFRPLGISLSFATEGQVIDLYN